MSYIYMDYSATAPMTENALNSMLPWFREEFGNPSSIYYLGQHAKNKLEECRKRIAKCIGAFQTEIFFTSGGTESDNWAIKSICYANAAKGKHIITSAIEHNAVLRTVQQMETEGYEVTYLKPDTMGHITPQQLEEAIRPDTILITMMLANNVVGTILDIQALAKTASLHRIKFHTDAVQAVGHIPVNVRTLGIDFLSMSAHKFGGPKGVGVLYCRIPNRLAPLLTGGGQEKELRSGTENVAGIVGMTAALEEATCDIEKESERLSLLRDQIIKEVCALPGVVITGDPVNRLPGVASFTIEDIGHSVYIVNELNEEGICVSSGSACSASSKEADHVLMALGYDEEHASGSLRVSLGKENNREQVELFLKVFPDVLARVRQRYKSGQSGYFPFQF